MKNSTLPLVAQSSAASREARRLTLSESVKVLVAGSATVAYLQFSTPGYPSEVVRFVVPSSHSVRQTARADQTVDAGDPYLAPFSAIEVEAEVVEVAEGSLIFSPEDLVSLGA